MFVLIKTRDLHNLENNINMTETFSMLVVNRGLDLTRQLKSRQCEGIFLLLFWVAFLRPLLFVACLFVIHSCVLCLLMCYLLLLYNFACMFMCRVKFPKWPGCTFPGQPPPCTSQHSYLLWGVAVVGDWETVMGYVTPEFYYF